MMFTGTRDGDMNIFGGTFVAAMHPFFLLTMNIYADYVIFDCTAKSLWESCKLKEKIPSYPPPRQFSFNYQYPGIKNFEHFVICDFVICIKNKIVGLSFLLPLHFKR